MNYKITMMAVSLSATFASQVYAETLEANVQRCLMEKLATVSPDTTVAQLHDLCRMTTVVQNTQSEQIESPEQPSQQAQAVVAVADEEVASPAIADEDPQELALATATTNTPYERRASVERSTRHKLFVLSPHKPNYFLPISYNTQNNVMPYEGAPTKLDKNEIQFQISLKVPVATDIFTSNDSVYAAYTNQSWWQAYHKDISSPFRETNHEPEVFYNLTTDYQLLGMKVRNLQLGVSHQSNGRSGELSRSWNRVYASALLEKDNFYVHIKPWLRISEKKKAYPDAAEGDDNPDITDYLGHGELTFFYRNSSNQTFNLMLRNNLKADNKGAVQVGWSFPLNGRLRGYAQYFSGYGESLIDYNRSVNRFSLGILLTDWL